MPTPTCQQTRREISDLLDGDTAMLPDDAQTHLSDCGDCTQFFDDSRALDGRLSSPVPAPGIGAADLPEGFHDRVLAAAREGDLESKVVGFPRWLTPAVGAAAAAIVVLMAWPKGESNEEIAAVDPSAPAPVEVPTGLPTGFESPIDVPAMTLVAGRGMEAAFGREADAIASDIEKIRGFFTSRVTVVSRIGL